MLGQHGFFDPHAHGNAFQGKPLSGGVILGCGVPRPDRVGLALLVHCNEDEDAMHGAAVFVFSQGSCMY